MNAIALRLVGDVGWGLKFRVFVGAALSTLDLITDVFITYTFWRDGKDSFFKTSTAMLGASILIMLFTTCLQNQKRGWKRVFSEMLPILLGLKPTLDAFRVASGRKIERGQIVDPLMEMTLTKGIEIFAESIPGVIIQLLAMMLEPTAPAAAAILSLFTSLLTTGFVSASLSYDWDSSPSKRIENPEFYGYIPNHSLKRTGVFMTMLLISSVMLLVRASVLSLLALVSAEAAMFYIFTDLGLYMLFKLFRRDFTYWLPYYNCTGVAISFILRTIVKVIADFTSNIHLRIPNEMGGAYWLFSFAFSLFSFPLTIIYYERNSGSKETITRIAWMACYVLLPLTLALKVVFFAIINKKYRKTFWSLKRGRDVTVGHMNSDKDSVKALVFIKNRNHWKSIEGKVEEWVRENWDKWKNEEPEWLDDNMKARIPPHMIPDSKDREKVEEMQSARRRSSLLGRISVRRRSSLIGAKKVAPNSGIDADKETDKSDVIREKG